MVTWHTLANRLKTQKFEIVPVKISDCFVESNSPQFVINEANNFTFTTQEISNDVNSENIEKRYTQIEKPRSGKRKTKSILAETKT